MTRRQLRHFTIIAGLVVTMACTSSGQSGSARMATVNGEVLTEEQIRQYAAGELEDLEMRKAQFEASYARDRHGVMERTLKTAIDDKLVTVEAAKRNMTPAELIATEVDGKVVAPTDKEVNDFYEANKARINVAGDEALRQVRVYLAQERRNAVYQNLITRLREEHDVEMYLEPFRVEVADEGFPAHGPSDAAVSIVEFSDFECPYCSTLYPTLKLIESNYGDQIRVVYRQFPLTTIHPNAQKAAEASLCAHDQQKFWELHDAMFQDPKNLSVNALKTKAVALQLDSAAFNSCLDSGKHVDAVKKDIFDGVKAGVTGTPALFINGRFLNGAQPYSEIARVIDEELARAKNQ